jgi:hypothetical protein
MNDQQKAALEQIKAVYDDGLAEINEREYHFLKMRHEQRRKVFAFYTAVAHEVQNGSFAFMDTPKFAEIEKVMFNSITFDGSLLTKLPEHWEEYSEDYVTLVATALGVISYPFLRGRLTDSTYQADQNQPSTFKKPI